MNKNKTINILALISFTIYMHDKIILHFCGNMDSSILISKCNEFLDELTKFKEDILKNLKIDDTTYNKLVEKLNRNLEVLEDLKEKMELQGFDTPFIGVGKLKGCDESDIYEIKTYSSYLRRMVDEKKGALERVKYAITAHKIALGNLLDTAGNKKIIRYLPYDGAYKDILVNLPSIFVKTYKRLLNIFESEGRGVLSSITMSLIIMENGKRKFKRVKIEEEDYEAYIRRNYGDAIITSLKKNYSKNKLLNDSYVKKTITLTYLITYKDEIEKEIEKKLEKLLSKHQRELISKYKKIMEELSPEDFEGGIIDMRVMDEIKLKKIKLNEKMEELGYYKDGKPTDELSYSLNREREISEKICYDIPLKYLSLDLFKYYLYNTPDDRARSNMFPSILITPSKIHLKWMKIDNINAPDVLDLKFLLERELPKYNISIKNSGGVALYLIHDWDAVKEFKYNKKDVEEVLNSIAPIDALKDILKDKIDDIGKLEKYNKIKKERTKKFLDALGKL